MASILMMCITTVLSIFGLKLKTPVMVTVELQTATVDDAMDSDGRLVDELDVLPSEGEPKRHIEPYVPPPDPHSDIEAGKAPSVTRSEASRPPMDDTDEHTTETDAYSIAPDHAVPRTIDIELDSPVTPPRQEVSPIVVGKGSPGRDPRAGCPGTGIPRSRPVALTPVMDAPPSSPPPPPPTSQSRDGPDEFRTARVIVLDDSDVESAGPRRRATPRSTPRQVPVVEQTRRISRVPDRSVSPLPRVLRFSYSTDGTHFSRRAPSPKMRRLVKNYSDVSSAVGQTARPTPGLADARRVARELDDLDAQLAVVNAVSVGRAPTIMARLDRKPVTPVVRVDLSPDRRPRTRTPSPGRRSSPLPRYGSLYSSKGGTAQPVPRSSVSLKRGPRPRRKIPRHPDDELLIELTDGSGDDAEPLAARRLPVPL